VTPLYSILLGIKVVRIILISIGIIGIAAIYFAYRRKDSGPKPAKGPLLRLDLEKKASVHPSEPPLDASPQVLSQSPTKSEPQAPTFKTYQRRYWTLSDFYRAFLILLSVIVAAGFILILLSQSTIDRMAQDLRSQMGVPQEERIALLFLGDESKNNTFQVMGVVRNISKIPINKLDAAVRFYARDGRLLETVLVRMDKDVITPDERSQFRLVYPDSKQEFVRYAVEFKLRQGDLVAYKDMRKPAGNPTGIRP
jgi:hypothetical protein